MKRRIRIFDTTLRDGEQAPGASMSIQQKIELARAIERMGADRIEAGFPASSPVQYEAVREVGSLLEKATTVALSRCVKGDIDAADKALAGIDRRMLHLFIATSPVHRKFKLKMDRAEVLKRLTEHMEYASQRFELIEFSAEDASRTEPDFLKEVIRVAINKGATTINIPDTVGYAVPDEFGALISDLCRDVPELADVELSVHCHNDLGLAVANSIAAVKAGADQVEVTVNGIGERAGNCAFEEFVMATDVRGDYFDFSTNIETDRIYHTSRLLQNITGIIIPDNKPVLGDNAFAHEAGIHQHGVLENRETYEIMRPDTIGRPENEIVLGRHSGKHAFKSRLEALGFSMDREQFDSAFSEFTSIADTRKEIYDEDVCAIAASVLGQEERQLRIIDFNSHTGNSLIPTASVKIKRGVSEFIASSTGEGPVDALFRAIDTALELKCILKEYVTEATGTGKNAQGRVKLSLEIDGNIYPGKGTSIDIIEASASAYLNACNCFFMSGIKKAGEE